jgi:hypothetical protein
VIAARVGDLRQQRWTGKAIAFKLGISPATVIRPSADTVFPRTTC